jgi:hypothetical protein
LWIHMLHQTELSGVFIIPLPSKLYPFLEEPWSKLGALTVLFYKYVSSTICFASSFKTCNLPLTNDPLVPEIKGPSFHFGKVPTVRRRRVLGYIRPRELLLQGLKRFWKMLWNRQVFFGLLTFDWTLLNVNDMLKHKKKFICHVL